MHTVACLRTRSGRMRSCAGLLFLRCAAGFYMPTWPRCQVTSGGVHRSSMCTPVMHTAATDQQQASTVEQPASIIERPAFTSQTAFNVLPMPAPIDSLHDRRHHPLASHIEMAQLIWATLLRPGDTVIDCTAGNGHDAVHLAQRLLLGADADCKQRLEGRLICLDVQQVAVEATRQRLADALPPEALERTVVYRGSFCNLPPPQLEPPIAAGSVALIVYNLGWLPGCDKTVMTVAADTLASLQAALPLLKRCDVMQCRIRSACIRCVLHRLGQLPQAAVAVLFVHTCSAGSYGLLNAVPSLLHVHGLRARRPVITNSTCVSYYFRVWPTLVQRRSSFHHMLPRALRRLSRGKGRAALGGTAVAARVAHVFSCARECDAGHSHADHSVQGRIVEEHVLEPDL